MQQRFIDSSYRGHLKNILTIGGMTYPHRCNHHPQQRVIPIHWQPRNDPRRREEITTGGGTIHTTPTAATITHSKELSLSTGSPGTIHAAGRRSPATTQTPPGIYTRRERSGKHRREKITTGGGTIHTTPTAATITQGKELSPLPLDYFIYFNTVQYIPKL